jgi:hypothetical protein
MWFEGVFGDQFDEIAMKGEVMGGSNVLYGKNPQEILNRTWPTRQKDLSGGYALKRLQDIFNRHQTPQARRP